MSVYKPEEKVDQLIKHFWKNGYMTVSRKFGKYLPPPKPVGNYQVDAVGKYKKKYVLGVTLSENELNDPQIYSKLEFLATRKTRYSHVKVTLFVGVPKDSIKKARAIVSTLSEETRKNIKLVPLSNN
ncbi:MAG: hypothetical protein D6830_04060 [Ignavibacteria bacterium]|nr:MAG: hypothetical protein D6830_04060 [Ignavibacteria bacterium]